MTNATRSDNKSQSLLADANPRGDGEGSQGEEVERKEKRRASKAGGENSIAYENSLPQRSSLQQGQEWITPVREVRPGNPNPIKPGQWHAKRMGCSS